MLINFWTTLFVYNANMNLDILWNFQNVCCSSINDSITRTNVCLFPYDSSSDLQLEHFWQGCSRFILEQYAYKYTYKTVLVY
jgi:hypothetical protein